ncbi:MAG: hypothetical protein ACSW8C_02700 [bacterium]
MKRGIYLICVILATSLTSFAEVKVKVVELDKNVVFPEEVDSKIVSHKGGIAKKEYKDSTYTVIPLEKVSPTLKTKTEKEPNLFFFPDIKASQAVYYLKEGIRENTVLPTSEEIGTITVWLGCGLWYSKDLGFRFKFWGSGKKPEYSNFLGSVENAPEVGKYFENTWGASVHVQNYLMSSYIGFEKGTWMELKTPIKLDLFLLNWDEQSVNEERLPNDIFKFVKTINDCYVDTIIIDSELFDSYDRIDTRILAFSIAYALCYYWNIKNIVFLGDNNLPKYVEEFYNHICKSFPKEPPCIDDIMEEFFPEKESQALDDKCYKAKISPEWLSSKIVSGKKNKIGEIQATPNRRVIELEPSGGRLVTPRWHNVMCFFMPNSTRPSLKDSKLQGDSAIEIKLPNFTQYGTWEVFFAPAGSEIPETAIKSDEIVWRGNKGSFYCIKKRVDKGKKEEEGDSFDSSGPYMLDFSGLSQKKWMPADEYCGKICFNGGFCFNAKDVEEEAAIVFSELELKRQWFSREFGALVVGKKVFEPSEGQGEASQKRLNIQCLMREEYVDPSQIVCLLNTWFPFLYLSPVAIGIEANPKIMGQDGLEKATLLCFPGIMERSRRLFGADKKKAREYRRPLTGKSLCLSNQPMLYYKCLGSYDAYIGMPKTLVDIILTMVPNAKDIDLRSVVEGGASRGADSYISNLLDSLRSQMVALKERKAKTFITGATGCGGSGNDIKAVALVYAYLFYFECPPFLENVILFEDEKDARKPSFYKCIHDFCKMFAEKKDKDPNYIPNVDNLVELWEESCFCPDGAFGPIHVEEPCCISKPDLDGDFGDVHDKEKEEGGNSSVLSNPRVLNFASHLPEKEWEKEWKKEWKLDEHCGKILFNGAYGITKMGLQEKGEDEAYKEVVLEEGWCSNPKGVEKESRKKFFEFSMDQVKNFHKKLNIQCLMGAENDVNPSQIVRLLKLWFPFFYLSRVVIGIEANPKIMGQDGLEKATLLCFPGIMKRNEDLFSDKESREYREPLRKKSLCLYDQRMLYYKRLGRDYAEILRLEGDILEAPLVDIILTTVPNAKGIDLRSVAEGGVRSGADRYISDLLESLRSQMVALKERKAKTFITGAIGCGNFGNDIRAVALVYAYLFYFECPPFLENVILFEKEKALKPSLYKYMYYFCGIFSKEKDEDPNYTPDVDDLVELWKNSYPREDF